MKRIVRFAAVTFFVFFVGGLGSFFLERGAAYLAGSPAFSRFSFLQDLGRGVTVVRPIERVVIRNGDEEKRTLRQAEALVGKALLSSGGGSAFGGQEIGGSRIVGETTGVFVTSDGGFLAYAPEVIDRGELSVLHNGTTFAATLLRVDASLGLAVVHVDGSGFPTASLRNDAMTLGEKAFFLWRIRNRDEWHLLHSYVAQGSLTSQSVTEPLTAQTFGALPVASAETQGAILFDQDAKLIGLLGFRADRTPDFIPAKTIEQFLSQ